MVEHLQVSPQELLDLDLLKKEEETHGDEKKTDFVFLDDEEELLSYEKWNILSFDRMMFFGKILTFFFKIYSSDDESGTNLITKIIEPFKNLQIKSDFSIIDAIIQEFSELDYKTTNDESVQKKGILKRYKQAAREVADVNYKAVIDFIDENISDKFKYSFNNCEPKKLKDLLKKLFERTNVVDSIMIITTRTYFQINNMPNFENLCVRSFAEFCNMVLPMPKKWVLIDELSPLADRCNSKDAVHMMNNARLFVKTVNTTQLPSIAFDTPEKLKFVDSSLRTDIIFVSLSNTRVYMFDKDTNTPRLTKLFQSGVYPIGFVAGRFYQKLDKNCAKITVMFCDVVYLVE